MHIQTNLRLTITLTLMSLLIFGCSARQTFSTAARPGDTVTLPIGAYYELDRG